MHGVGILTLHPHTRTYHKYEGKSFVRRVDVEIALTVDFPLPTRDVNIQGIRVRQENEIKYEASRSNSNFTLHSGTMRHSKSLATLHVMRRNLVNPYV